ncbi:MBL fold metallo-hydrolase [Thermomonospora amylolytica]|uniref:MBL fold metallo-hydrolase n=1 Tax=Thermomonospora amylolytica TaxID=1411117 RepID=UPI000E6BA727|nr:MBL fold metallo-hydrolase [Thermomonospora amylolytica]
MTPPDRTSLTPILRAVADVVCSRPSATRLPSADRLVEEQADWLIEVLRRLPGVRARAAAALAAGRCRGRTRHLAALLLHPDDAVVEAALGWADLTERRPRRKSRAERAGRTIADLRQRLAAERRRYQYALDDVRQLKALVGDMEAVKADMDERAAELNRQLAIERARWREPRLIAAALLRALEQPSSTRTEDAAARDPKNVTAVQPHNETLRAAAAATGRPPEELLRIVRAIVDPASTAPRASAVRELDLRVTPLGGDTEIGGSCLLVEAGGTRLLIDAGLRPGDPPLPPRDIARALDGPLHGVVITHAHNDHCGYVPALLAQRPGLRVLATPETVRLMPVMWGDGVKVMRDQARRRNGWGGSALYGHEEVGAAARRCEEMPFGTPRQVGGLTVELFPAGHILGAAGVVVRAGDRRIVVTGDISGFRQESVDGYDIPESARRADLLVLESTCCGDGHGDREVRVGDFVREVREVCQGGGRVLVPAFALGRAQEVALLLRRHLPEIPVRIDGMAIDVSTAFETATAGSARPLTIFGGLVARAARPAELDTFRTGVVITTSGMLTAGPAVAWAARILPEPGSAVFISGYQDEESTGARLLSAPNGTITLPAHDGEVTVPVKARVADMRLSAHADRSGLLEIADEVAARRIMLVHGILQRQRLFRDTLHVRDHRTVDTAPWRP